MLVCIRAIDYRMHVQFVYATYGNLSIVQQFWFCISYANEVTVFHFLRVYVHIHSCCHTWCCDSSNRVGSKYVLWLTGCAGFAYMLTQMFY